MKLITNGATYYLKILQHHSALPWVLMFHGFMGSSKAMEPLAGRLTQNCNPVVIDLLGHGHTTAVADAERFRTNQQISDLHSILDRLQFQNLFLYGYSMGGRLAQHLFMSASSRFSGLILESTHCGITNRADREKRKALDEQRASEIEADIDAFLDRWINLPLFQSPGSKPDTGYESILQDQKPELMAASLRGFGAGEMPPICGQLSQIKKPVGLIAGESDQKYVDKMSEMAQLCTDSELKIVNGAGHRVHADRPEQTAQFITQFLRNHG